MKDLKDQVADAIHANDQGMIRHLQSSIKALTPKEQIELYDYVREVNSQRFRMVSGR